MTDDAADFTQADEALAQALGAGRPVPAPRFRSALHRHVIAADPGYGPRPARLRPIACGLIALALFCFALALLQAIGRM